MAFERKEIVNVIPCKTFNIATGTWTYTVSSGLDYQLKTATDETSTISAALPIPKRTDIVGAKLKYIYVPLRCITANFDAAPAVTLTRQNFSGVNSGADTDVSTATITTTNDGVVTADSNDRLLTITVSSPTDEYSISSTGLTNLFLSIALDCGATTVVRAYSWFAKWELLF